MAPEPVERIDVSEIKDPMLGMDFVLITGGVFLMGDLSGRGQRWEKPAHKVTVNDFNISQHEVTFEQYDLFCAVTGRPKPDDEGWGRGQRPVINVTWQDAQDFAAWMSQLNNQTFRLPTEAEWEYAARAGTSTPYWWGHKLLPGMAVCAECGSEWDGQSTAPVGSFKPNPWGLYDMNGNVWEWVQDNFAGEEVGYQGAPTDGSAWVMEGNPWRVNRGGSYSQYAAQLRSTDRNWDAPDTGRRQYGFRLVMESD